MSASGSSVVHPASRVQNGESTSTEFELVSFPLEELSARFPRDAPYVMDDGGAAGGSDMPAGLDTFRTLPLGAPEFNSMLDRQGRIIDEHAFRKRIFRGGLDPEIRPEAWSFLFGLFPCHSTRNERESLSCKLRARYRSLRVRWKRKLKETWPTFDLEHADNSILETRPQFETEDSGVQESGQEIGPNSDIVAIEAESFASRHPCDVENLCDSLRYISKDVPRTERRDPFFKCCDNQIVLRDVLATFSLVCPDVGYVQGMNDIASRFLIVMESEAFAFWCFLNYVLKVQTDFLSDGMIYKITILKKLLQDLDADMYHYLSICKSEDLIFCHKWLLLSFLREFPLDDGLKLFEILSTQHLELNSMVAQKKQAAACRNYEMQNGYCLAPDLSSSDYTFDLFVCVAILVLHKNAIYNAADGSEIFQIISQLSERLDLDQVICQAERLFNHYCQRSVLDSFLVL